MFIERERERERDSERETPRERLRERDSERERLRERDSERETPREGLRERDSERETPREHRRHVCSLIVKGRPRSPPPAVRGKTRKGSSQLNNFRVGSRGDSLIGPLTDIMWQHIPVSASSLVVASLASGASERESRETPRVLFCFLSGASGENMSTIFFRSSPASDTSKIDN